MEKQIDISELIQLMFVGLMGANNEINKILKAFHEKHDKPSHGFLFYEFLVHQPLYKEPPTDSFENTWIFSPFPHRLARRSFVKTEEEIAENEILIEMDVDQFTQRLYKCWRDRNDKEESIKIDNKILKLKFKFTPLDVPFIEYKEFYNPFFVEVLNYTTGNMDELYDILSNKTGNKISKKSFKILKELRGPLLGDKNEVTSLLIPITSSEIFYGDLMVLLPYFKKTEREYENKLKQLVSKLLTCIKKHYVPALALIHEHFFENLISKQKNIGISELMGQYDVTLQNDKIGASYYSPICRRATIDSEPERVKSCYECEYFGWEKSSDNVVEKYLHKLWQDRKTLREQKYINDSLFFKDYLYTDPHMLDLLEKFLKPSKAKLKKDGKKLPSILVVAPPGAGKDEIPTLLRLFSDCYNRGQVYKLNMASLKPDAIVPFAMVGGEIACEENKDKLHFHRHHEEIYKLKGILKGIREKTRKEFEDFIEKEGLDKEVGEYKKNIELRESTIITINIPDLVDELIKELKAEKEKLEGRHRNFIIIKKMYAELKVLGLKKTLEEVIKINNDLKQEVEKSIQKLEVQNSSIKNQNDHSIKKELVAKLLKELEPEPKKFRDKLKELKNKELELEDELEKLEDQLKYTDVENLAIVEKLKELVESNIKKLKDEQEELFVKLRDGFIGIKELEVKQEEINNTLSKLNNIKNSLKKGSDVKNLGPEEKLIVKKLYGCFPTIVLDELNSMSIESQGVLLRFLENGEITPIGGYEDKMSVDGEDDKDYRGFITDFLVVGIMNEDPEAITREEAIRFLEKEKYIGGLLGDLLYEHIIKVRRLRPDLRARMMRNGMFEIPKLEEHPADIPVIFCNILDKDKGDHFPNSTIRITMDALELLMSPELEWYENIRLLQTFTKKVEEIVYEDYENKKQKGEDMPKIYGKELIIIREKHIREAMEAIGMIKE